MLASAVIIKRLDVQIEKLVIRIEAPVPSYDLRHMVVHPPPLTSFHQGKNIKFYLPVSSPLQPSVITKSAIYCCFYSRPVRNSLSGIEWVLECLFTPLHVISLTI